MTDKNTRWVSLDALRGYTIAAMIMVNYPGSEDAVYFTLRHSEWNGLSFTDLVAPFFLYFIGVSIALAYSKKLAAGMPKNRLYKKIFIRSLKIYAVGMFLNLMPAFDLHHIRWTGTLQRISFVFCISAIIYLNTNWKQQAWLAGSLLLIYWFVLTCIPIPGLGSGMFEPGINIVAWVDKQLLPGDMWRGNWDPESILTIFTAVVTCITGMLAGNWMLTAERPADKVNWLMTVGAILSIVGYFWGLVFPVNENLWTSSFVLVTSGFASLVFGATYFLIDIHQATRGVKPGVIFGANAIAVYFLADIWALIFYVHKFGGSSLNVKFVNWLGNAGLDLRMASLLYALLFVTLNFFPAWLLYKRRIFIRL